MTPFEIDDAVVPPDFCDLELFRSRWSTSDADLGHDPPGGWQAATAIVVAPGDQYLEFVVIERARRAGDRWSGQMALPGGKRERRDPDLVATAVRETHEEVGLALDRPLARLGEGRGSSAPGVLATYVFTLDQRPPLTPEPSEVAGAWWMPLPYLLDPARTTEVQWAGGSFPGIDHVGRPIWGLTYQTLRGFIAAHGHSLP